MDIAGLITQVKVAGMIAIDHAVIVPNIKNYRKNVVCPLRKGIDSGIRALFQKKRQLGKRTSLL